MSKEKKIWLFFEMVESNHSSMLRGVATSRAVKERFEKALDDEMKSKNRTFEMNNWWIVEENIADHLYGHRMFSTEVLAWKYYSVRGRQIDGD